MRLLAVVALLAGCNVAKGKLTVPFVNGWRFYHGDDPSGPGVGPNACAFDSIANASCTNVEKNGNRWTEFDCKMSCCYNPECLVWQYFGSDGCRHGTNDSVCTPTNGASTGGKRSVSPPFKRDYDFKETSFDDTNWKLLSLPHDFIINETFVHGSDNHHGFLPRGTGWYRKHFAIPSDWKGQTVYLEFEGGQHYKEVYINGEWVQDHSAGYTEFTVRLDNVTSLQYGSGSANVIAIRVDASYGSGHWYEGGGLYRKVHLVCVNATAHTTYRSVYLNPETDGTSLNFSAELESLDPSAPEGTIIPIKVVVQTRGGVVVAESKDWSWPLQRGAPGIFSKLLHPTVPIELWSTRNPVTYEFSVTIGDVANEWTDTHNSTCAFRSTKWNSTFSLNNVQMELRGFSHHNSFAGTGVTSSPRLNLFRAQSSKAVGANFWRCSHNPYAQDLYEILTSVGILAWDENRDFGYEYRHQMADMVRHHRAHASVVVWSLCNEDECEKYSSATSVAYKSAASELDPMRPTAANELVPGASISSDLLDIIGLSHGDNQSLVNLHARLPDKPLLLSECCSCVENRVGPRNFTACEAQQNSPGTALPYVSGSIGVWTLMDYFGESGAWPQSIGNFGQFDISGFPKAHAWWYRVNWLAKVAVSDPSRPLVKGVSHVARVVNLWDSVDSAIYCAVSTAQGALRIDGVEQGVKLADGDGMTVWPGAPYASNVSCSAIQEGSVAATHTLVKPKTSLRLQLVVDVPSPATGTGDSLYLDAQDLGLIRAQVVDEFGVVDSTVSGNVTFTVSGPGRLVGLGAAPDSLLPVQGNVIAFYGGLVRAVVQVTVDCVSGMADLVSAVDHEHGPLTFMAQCPSPAPSITVTAQSQSYGAASITLRTSSAPLDHPFAVARANANLTYSYIDDITS
ncbi:Beta-galactosidase BoGH2A [Diplonema papillatum]|nr:Beta-galactosidase BoGH2A [Diplonema papillatum]